MTRVNNKLRFLIMLGIVLLATLLFSTKVQATTAKGMIEQGKITSNSLNNIPDTVNVNLKESECEKAPKAILNLITEELKKQNITVRDTSDLWNEDFTKIEPDSYISIRVSLNDINKVSISISNIKDKNDNMTWEDIINREITIAYNNSSNYNEKDKKYVENLLNNMTNNSGKYTYITYSDVQDSSKVYSQTKNLEEAINDKTITFVSFGGGGSGPKPFNIFGFGNYKVFKDGIYYSSLKYETSYRKQVIIPNNIEDTDTAYINYALPKINQYLKNWYKGYNIEAEFKPIKKLEKISGCYYKISYDTTDYYDTIVLRKETGTPVGNNIFIDKLQEGVNVTATVKENATMEQKTKDKGYNKILGSFELKLTGATKLTSPINVTFNVGTEHNNKQVYVLHQKQDGTYENFEKKVANGKVIVTVSELSPFVLALKENASTPSTQEPSTNKPTEQPKQDDKKPDTTTNKPKDETPKTGSDNIVVIVSSIVCVLSIVGIAIIKKF